MRILRNFSILLILGGLIWFFSQTGTPYQLMSGETMGTYYNIKIRTSKEDKMLPQKIKQRLDEVSQKMSVFAPDSEINGINNAKKDEWLDLSAEMSLLLKDAHKVWKLSNGNFDPTVGKLVDLWGFGVSKPQNTPTKEQIKDVLKYTGFDKLSFNKDYTRIKKKHDSTYLNLSAIAKGYGVDSIVRLLEEEGYTDFVVEIGGEVAARGNRSEDEKGWKIGVIRPDDTHENAYVIALKDYAVATSGDYRNFYYKEGQKYAHTISPQTGYPVKHGLTSVTALAKNCMDADALATAAMAMGEEKALAFANNNNLAMIMFVRQDNDELKALISEKAKKLLGE